MTSLIKAKYAPHKFDHMVAAKPPFISTFELEKNTKSLTGKLKT